MVDSTGSGMIRVKICGITRLKDALAAVEAGADALGFMFYPASKRLISTQAAGAIIRELPHSIRKVGVFVDADPDEVWRTAELSGIDTLQFHGRESPDICRQFGSSELWKAFRIQSRESLTLLRDYMDVDAWLLDSYVPGEPGGTGASFNWEIATEARSMGRPIVLAGGLTPENVGEAVRQVQPFAVDVSSGVESAPGQKDPDRIRAFIAAAKAAFP
jgi:phosphoribosylanthranilate isomerase